jgi:hypothetical protein
LTLRVISNNDENFSVEVTSNSAYLCPMNVEVYPLNSETVTFGGSAQTGSTLTHICTPGVNISATGGSNGNFAASGNGTFGGNITASSGTLTGPLTINGSGNRPVTIDSNVNIKGDAGGWAMEHGFIGSSGTARGGFGAYGSVDALSYYYVGIFGSEKLTIDYTSGAATFNGTLSASNFSGSSSGTNTGDQTLAGLGGLPLTGGTMTGTITFANNVGTCLYGTMADNDQWRILAGNTGSNAGYLEIATADDGTEPIYFRQYTGVFATLVRTATILDGSGNTSLPNNLQLGTIGGGTGTATPNTINLGSTFSNTAGSNLKLKLFEDTGGNIYGIGISNNQMDFNVASGGGYRFYTGSVTAPSFFEVSDIRFKNVLETNPNINVLGIDVIKFTRADDDTNAVRYGYSAQQVKEVIPEAVAGDENLSVNYMDIHTLKIAALEKRIAELEAKLNK